jgi:glucose/arabinose dehydrogenase
VIRRALVLAAVLAAGVSSSSAAAPNVKLVEVAKGLARPLYVAAAPGEQRVLYIVQQRGLIRVLDKGKLRTAPLIDLRGRVWAGRGELGLLSIAFDPAYASNRRFYVAFNDADRVLNVVSYESAGGRANLQTERTLIRVPHPDDIYHAGGQLTFGPDGKLYVGVGDGGYLDVAGQFRPDPHGNSQNLDVLLGKIFRLDVNDPTPQAEIVASGLRNPWRFSYDAALRTWVVGDVGWDSFEEINLLPAGAELTNFGWSTYEGRRKRFGGPELSTQGKLAWPALTYATRNGDNCAITAGYVYRGRAIRSLRGRYVFGDYCAGTIWSAKISKTRISDVRRLPVKVKALDSFGVDNAGELYAVSLDGRIFRLAA